MIDFAAHIAKINKAKKELETCTNPKRRHDLKKYIGRLHKELSEAKKWQRGEMYDERTEP